MVGTATRNLDFAAGLAMAGYARRHGPSQGTLEPLQARALAVADPHGNRVALVALDLVYVTRAIAQAVEERLARSVGLPHQALAISATHTHSGPDVGNPDDPAGQMVVETAAEAVQAALGSMAPAELWSDAVGVEALGMNRRNGTAPPLSAHVIVATRPGRPGDVMATLLEFACHATILEHDNVRYSPDYPGHARRLIEQLVGGTCVFVQGCSGDINPVFDSHQPSGAHLAGALLAGTVGTSLLRSLRHQAGAKYVNLTWNGDYPVTTVSTLRPVPAGRVWAAQGDTVVDLAALADPAAAAARLAAARQAFKAGQNGPDHHALGAELGEAWAQDLRASGYMDAVPADPPTQPTNLTSRVLGLGPAAAICALPGEVFWTTGQDLRQRLEAPPHLLLATCANQAVGYLPPVHEFAEKGYEIGEAGLAKGAAEAVVETTAGLLAGGGPPGVRAET